MIGSGLSCFPVPSEDANLGNSAWESYPRTVDRPVSVWGHDTEPGGLLLRELPDMPRLSRRSLFEQLDRPALRPLPAERYVFAQWKKARVNIDYHVEVDGHYYSVPHALIRR